MPFGTACCAIEFMATAASKFDLARFGMERHELLAAPGRRADLRRPRAVQARARPPPHLAADAAAQVVHLDGRVRVDAAACSTTTPWCRASTRSSRWTSTCPAVRRAPKACIYGIMMLQKKVMRRADERQVAPRGDGAGPESQLYIPPAVIDEAVGAVRQLRSSDTVRPVSSSFTPVVAGQRRARRRRRRRRRRTFRIAAAR